MIGSTEPFEVLCECIRRVRAGQIWVANRHLHWLVDALAERRSVRLVSAAGNKLLTSRQEEVVGMVGEGMTVPEISSKLHLSRHTVKNHLFRIYDKLGVSNRVELVLYAMCHQPGANAPSS